MSLLSIINNHQELLIPFEDKFKQDWIQTNEEEHQAILNKYQMEYSELEKQLTILQGIQVVDKKKNDELHHLIEQKKLEIETLDIELENKRNQFDNFQFELDRKTEEIKKDASKFASDLTLLAPFLGKNVENVQSTENQSKQLYLCLTREDDLSGEETNTIEEFTDSLALNLEELGVHDKYSTSLVGLLLSCLFNNKIIFLVGSGAFGICQALSASIGENGILVIDSSSHYSHQIIEEIKKQKERIVVVNDILQNDFLYHLDNLNELTDKFIFITAPYFDNLELISSEIIRQTFPLFVQPLFKTIKHYEALEKAKLNADFIKEFEEIPHSNKKDLNSISTSAFHHAKLPSSIKNELLQIIRDAKRITNGDNYDFSLVAVFLPIFTLIKKKNQLKLFVDKNHSKFSEDGIQTFNFYGEFEEDE